MDNLEEMDKLLERDTPSRLNQEKIENMNRLITSTEIERLKNSQQGFPGGAVENNLPANAGNTDSSPGPGRSHMPQNN